MKAQKDLEKKIEEMTSTINKAVYKEANPYWRKHIPVYGWTKMNAPGFVCGSLLNKYQKRKDELNDENVSLDKKDQLNELDTKNEDEVTYSKIFGTKKSNTELLDVTRYQDPTEKFMKNSKNNDLHNFQEIFNNYEKNKKNLNLENTVPHNFNTKKEQNLKKYSSETGQKTSYIWLTTDPYEKKKDYVL